MDLLGALGMLDTLNDDHWTANGDAKLDALKEFTGKQVTRQSVIDVAPTFNRENPLPKPEPEPESPPEPEVDFNQVIIDYIAGEPMEPKEFVPFLNSLPKEALPALEAVLKEQLTGAEKAESSAQEIRVVVKRSLAYCKSRIKTEIPGMSNQEAVKDFIISQARSRGSRVAATKEILKGVDLKTLDPRSAIDRAMDRKTARGTRRPSYGGLKLRDS